MSHVPSPALSPEEIESFLTHGFVVIKGAFSKETAGEWAARCYHRLGIDPNDRSTWTTDRVHMGGSEFVEMKDFAPRAYQAACQLLGGEERLQTPCIWSDHFIVNLGEGADRPWQAASPECNGWHKDGDFFRHYLDSPEQGLLTLVLWTDVIHQGGPTYLATDSVGVIARFLADKPEGVRPDGFGFKNMVGECQAFAEGVGEAGDVFLIHPYMLHAVSQNVLRVPRIITNPPISLKEPMQFNRENPADFSPVELAILRGLGVDRLDFAISGEREKIVPHRVAMQEKLMAEEKARLASL